MTVMQKHCEMAIDLSREALKEHIRTPSCGRASDIINVKFINTRRSISLMISYESFSDLFLATAVENQFKAQLVRSRLPQTFAEIG